MQDTILLLIDLFLTVFVLTSMFGTGLSLTVGEIIEPLKNGRLVALALVANFVLVPALAYAIGAVLGLNEGQRAGLIILASCAGAPFLPKLATIGKGNLALSVGLMVLLMVVTVVYAPIVLPLLIPGVSVSPWAIAQSLIILMLIPLAIGLAIRAWLPDPAATLQPFMNQASSISLILMAVLGLLVGFQDFLATFGTGSVHRRCTAYRWSVAYRHAAGGIRSGDAVGDGPGHGPAQRFGCLAGRQY